MNKTHRLLLALLLVQLLASGCTALNTFPNYARPGDTVALSVGSPDGMSRTNTTAVFVSKTDPGYPLSPVEYPVTMRSIFKLYGDRASALYQRGAITNTIVNNSGHEAWTTIAALDLDPSVPVGPGEIRFTTTATYPTIGTNINNLPIELEIIPGTGASNLFEYEIGTGATALGDLTTMEPQPHAAVFPAFLGGASPYPNYGAIEIKMQLPASATLVDRSLRVWLDEMTSATSSGRSMTYHVANGQDLTVMILSHLGTLKYYEARMNVVLPSGVTFTSPPQITSVSYYDINGNVATGPAIVDYTVEER